MSGTNSIGRSRESAQHGSVTPKPNNGQPPDILTLSEQSRLDAVKQKLPELLPYPESSLTLFQKIKDIAEAVGHGFLHLPGIGLITSFFAKKRIASNTEQAKAQFRAANQIRMKILVGQKRGQNYEPLDIKRGVRPSEFWTSGGNQFGADLLLANTVEYAQLQINKRLKKLGIADYATDVQRSGAAVGIVAPPIGLTMSLAGLGTKLAIKIKSAFTFMGKLFTGTLGRDRNEHAALLYGLALMHKNNTFNDGGDPNVQKALNFVKPLEERREFKTSCERAHNLLVSLGIDPEAEDFKKNGFQKIREFLKS